MIKDEILANAQPNDAYFSLRVHGLKDQSNYLGSHMVNISEEIFHTQPS